MKTKVADGINAHFFPKAEEVCKIIVTCRKAGVARLNLGALSVEFYSPEAREAREVSPEPPQAPYLGAATTPAAEVPEKIIQAAERLEAESIEEQGITQREEQIANLLMEDPLLAEQMMEDGDLLEPEGVKDGSGDAKRD